MEHSRFRTDLSLSHVMPLEANGRRRKVKFNSRDL